MPKLLIRSSDTDEVRHLSIEGKEAITVGRCNTNALCLPHSFVSNFHAVFIPEKGGAILKDLQSTNGTHVNGEPIQKRVLVHLDEIVIGNYEITYREPSPDPAEDRSVEPAGQLPPMMRKNWIAIQKQFDYPVNAIGIKINPSDTRAMQVWKTEKIDEDGRLLIREHA